MAKLLPAKRSVATSHADPAQLRSSRSKNIDQTARPFAAKMSAPANDVNKEQAFAPAKESAPEFESIRARIRCSLRWPQLASRQVSLTVPHAIRTSVENHPFAPTRNGMELRRVVHFHALFQFNQPAITPATPRRQYPAMIAFSRP